MNMLSTQFSMLQSYKASWRKNANYCSEAHLKERNFPSKDLSWAAGVSVRRGRRHTVVWVRGVLGAPPPHGSTVASCG